MSMAAIPLSKDEPRGAEEGYDEAEPFLLDSKKRKSSFWRGRNLGWLMFLACLLGFILGLAIGVAVLLVWSWQPRADLCFQESSMPSPVQREVPILYHTQQFNGSLMIENVFRRLGSPEVDDAWEALGVNYRPLSVPLDVGLQSGLAIDQVKLSNKYGGGFPANVEGLHHLHCANLVRKALYYNIDYYRELGEGAFTNDDAIVQKHVSHCLDIIRQQLMCTIDVGVLGQVWYQPDLDESPSAFVDFNTKHTCRNFEAVRKWAQERQMPEDVPDDWLEPPKPGDRVWDVVP